MYSEENSEHVSEISQSIHFSYEKCNSHKTQVTNTQSWAPSLAELELPNLPPNESGNSILKTLIYIKTMSFEH